jgi:hypothetical protein
MSLALAVENTYWDNFEDEQLGEYRLIYNPRTRRNEKKWFPVQVQKPKRQPRWVITQPTTTTPATTTPATIPTTGETTPPILPPGTVIKQTTLDKLLDFGKYQIQQKVELEKAKQAAGIAPGTVPTASQQAAMLQAMTDNNSVGSQSGKALDGALGWISENILVVGAGFLIVALVFMNPPGSGKGR